MTTRADGRFIETRLKDLNLQRGNQQVLHGVNWTVRPGERWVLAGANGAGKTQLLKVLAGSVWPTPAGADVRQYRWRGEAWHTPQELMAEIAYLGP